MRVCFYTLGCKVNLNETGALEQMFRGAGFTIVPEGEEADVFVVNSCTVTNFGDQKSRKWLRRAKRENPGAVTVLTGCYPQAFPEEAANFLEADLVCGNGDRKAILDNVLKLLDGHERIVAVTPHKRGEKPIWLQKTVLMSRDTVYDSELQKESTVVHGIILFKNTVVFHEKDQQEKERLQLAFEKADSASRAKTEFVNRMSHDIRTEL